jgi:hypothetical protein
MVVEKDNTLDPERPQKNIKLMWWKKKKVIPCLPLAQRLADANPNLSEEDILNLTDDQFQDLYLKLLCSECDEHFGTKNADRMFADIKQSRVGPRGQAESTPPRVTSKQDPSYLSLPFGAQFIDPTGQLRTKGVQH